LGEGGQRIIQVEAADIIGVPDFVDECEDEELAVSEGGGVREGSEVVLGGSEVDEIRGEGVDFSAVDGCVVDGDA